MSNGVFKGTVIIVLLIAFAFVVGTLAADGAKSAIAPIGFVCGLLGLLLLGRNCWVLVFALPPLIALFDLQVFQNLPVGYAVSAVVLVYWVLMYVMGYVKIKWYSAPLLDIATLIFVTYFLLTWTWNPVTIQAFVNNITHEGDAYVGGREYIWCIFSIICYVLISIIPLQLRTVLKLLSVIVWVSLPFILLNTIKMVLLGSAAGDIGEQMQSSRYEYLRGIGNYLTNILLCKYGILGIMCSPWKLLLLGAGGLAIALSGFRGAMFRCALMVLFTQYLHRQLIIAFLPCVMAYGLISYMASENMIADMPYGVRRVLSALPGIKDANDRAAINAQSSLDWRYKLWEWAMNPATGYIRDYMWGDGFGIRMSTLALQSLQLNRGKMDYGNQHLFAQRGLWHSGWVTAIHRTGYVGLCILSVWCLVVTLHVVRLCVALRNVKGKEYAYYYVLPLIVEFVIFYISAGTYSLIFQMFFNVALAKLLYVKAIEEGHLKPMWQRKIYVPLMIRETEETPLAEKA